MFTCMPTGITGSLRRKASRNSKHKRGTWHLDRGWRGSKHVETIACCVPGKVDEYINLVGYYGFYGSTRIQRRKVNSSALVIRACTHA